MGLAMAESLFLACRQALDCITRGQLLHGCQDCDAGGMGGKCVAHDRAVGDQ